MTCTQPRQAFYPLPGAKSNKLIFRKDDPFAGEPVTVPCRGCMSCKYSRAQGRAFQLYAEAFEHVLSCCVTLTYDEEHLPKFGSLSRTDVSDFIRSLRDYYRYRDIVVDFKYFNAGEYGGKNGRPHHHVIIYGYDFPDKVYKVKRKGNVYYESKLLDSLWSKGIAEIGDVSTATCNYVAKYVLKKEFGMNADAKRLTELKVVGDDGIIYYKEHEFNTGSKNLGRMYYEKYRDEIYPNDYVVMYGSDFKFKVPEIFDKWLKVDDPVLYEKVKEKRKRKVEESGRVFTKDDLAAIDKNLRARLSLYGKRSL